jgi:hypothetical protein
LGRWGLGELFLHPVDKKRQADPYGVDYTTDASDAAVLGRTHLDGRFLDGHALAKNPHGDLG